MRLPKLRYALLIGAALGAIVPLAYIGCIAFLPSFSVRGNWLHYFWPFDFMLLGTRDLAAAPAWGIIGISVAANAGLYTLAFLFVWCVGWFLRAWRTG